jgi:DNA-binding transcriptional MerR regulator
MTGLTIGQLAAHAGVTVRAVRHYHQRGLLAEPARDASGYRRYDAPAVLELIRIKILADAGVPLARIGELLHARPEQLANAVAQIDETVRRQIAELEDRRRRLARLTGGDDVFLPAELVALLDDLRAAGVGRRTVRSERDGWILLLARYPERALGWIADKRARLADPDFQALYRRYDAANDWDADDPRVEQLADAVARYLKHRRGGGSDYEIDDPAVVALMNLHFAGDSSPAVERVVELADAKLAGHPLERSALSPPSSSALGSSGGDRSQDDGLPHGR